MIMKLTAGFEFLEQSASVVAPRLLGCLLTRQLDGQVVTVKIVEVEAYDQTDAASHSYHGKTPRTDVMFGPPGRLYVYFTYGMHYCCNIVTGPPGEGSAVLIRAVEPVDGVALLSANRPIGLPEHQLTNGPAKLCQALRIDTSLNGHDLHVAPLQLMMQPAAPAEAIQTTTRIGITKAVDTRWRFYLKHSDFISRQ